MATEALRQQIISSEILPGTRLVETNLAEQLAISRGTLRIALYQLAQEGLVKQTPYTGWATSSIEPEDLWELYTLRAGLESTAARILCEKMSPANQTSIKKSFADLEEACQTGKYSRIAEKDFLFHRSIIDLSQNRRLSEHYRLVAQQIRVFVASTYNFVQKPEDVLDHHRPFMDALLQSNADEAAKLLWNHAIGEGKRLHSYLLSIREDVSWGEQPADDPTLPL